VFGEKPPKGGTTNRGKAALGGMTNWVGGRNDVQNHTAKRRIIGDSNRRTGRTLSLLRFLERFAQRRIGKSDKTVATDSAAQADAARKPQANVIASPTKLAIDDAPVLGLEEVFRFDIAPADVLRRWPRVSTELPYLQLHGYRVPLVSGTDANRAGRRAHLLFQSRPTSAADHFSRHNGRSAGDYHAFDQPLPVRPASEQRSQPPGF